MTTVPPHFRFASFRLEAKKAWFHMIHFDAKHQKSELKTKVNKQKLSEKIDKNVTPETKLGSKIMWKILNFASFEAKKFSPTFRFETKITKSKRSEKCKAKKKFVYFLAG